MYDDRGSYAYTGYYTESGHGICLWCKPEQIWVQVVKLRSHQELLRDNEMCWQTCQENALDRLLYTT
ncbi:hypothetical protein BDQ94DRAFT_154837 [Aspergillus welwitschiae]|uniref:Uncharacterized protein n=1 Tax=Aspergillus welwitschiae TaxID=1341132 RepID=A0A3F3PJ13_9EURO|nr:hypothetical protein BDQ94DRAFT_154837 [Aspergillus welwitschiae]RDH26925.1 hypothetical protein BDQ94DRAFT_154837 [Aspergillus welwitschiae]